MPIHKINQNIVVAAKSFNPSIFSQLWLVKENIMEEKDFTSPVVFSPVAVDIRTSEYQLLVIPDRLQLTFAKNIQDKTRIIKKVVEAIVTKLSHTPYIAIGFNVLINFIPSIENKYAILNKDLMFNESNPLSDFFNNPDARYGFYCSKDVFGMRLKLDVKPSHIIDTNKVKKEFLAFNFNFHKDLNGEDKVSQIISLFSSWEQAEKHCNEIIQKFEEKWSSQE